MIFNRLNLINKDQKGFTILELIVAMLVVSIVATAAIGITFQIITGSERGNNRELALSNIQSAANWLALDAAQAYSRPRQGPSEDIIPADDDVPVVTLNWPVTLSWINYFEDSNKYVCKYSKESSGKLTRSESIYQKDGTLLSQTSTTVAENINTGDDETYCQYNWQKEIIILTVEAAVGEVKETRTYEIVSRAMLGLGQW